MDQPPVRLMPPAPAVGPRRSQHLRRSKNRGQALAEFAIVVPVFMLIAGGIIQFGIIFWGQNTLNQVARDTGRWEATQQFSPCSAVGNQLATQAGEIAQNSSLIGYAAGEWSTTTVYSDNSALPANPPSSEGVEAVWTNASGTETCPPSDNTTVWFVTIRVSHVVPVFFPWIPGNGALSTTTQFRMEPAPAP